MVFKLNPLLPRFAIGFELSTYSGYLVTGCSQSFLTADYRRVRALFHCIKKDITSLLIKEYI